MMSFMPDAEAFEATRRAHFAVTLHNPQDFEGMRRAGRLAAEVLDLLVPEVKPGITTEYLDKLAYDYVVSHGGVPACLGYRGYRHTLCTSINHVVCHGIPNDKPMKEGDIVNIDVTLILEGWHGDSSRMYPVGEIPRRAERLIEVTHEAMMRGIAVIKPGATTGDIGHAIQAFVEAQHMSVVRDFCGHGLGRPHVKVLSDGWTAVTRDRSLSAQFEHTVAVTPTGVEVFTFSPAGLDKPPYRKA